MKLIYKENLTRGKVAELDLPNLRDIYQIPHRVLIESNGKIAFKLSSNKNSVLQYNEPYFKTFQEISLKEYQTRLSDGENFQISITNMHKDPQDIQVEIEYTHFAGNILFTQTSQKAIKGADLSDYGNLTRVLFKSDNPIVAIQITPIYESNSKNWIETTRIEVNSNQYELDLTKDFRRYSKYLKFVKFSVEQATESDVYLIGYGFRH